MRRSHFSSLKKRTLLAARSLLRGTGLKPFVDAAPRAELEQSMLRGVIGGAVLAYLLVYTSRDGIIDGAEREVLAVAVGLFLFSIAITAHVVFVGRDSVARRIFGMVVDNGVTSYCLMNMGEGGAVVLGIYLFVAFGNGFRYGRNYLHVSQVLGLLGFSLVLALSDFWSQHLAIGIGVLISMIILPFYVGVLAERIKLALRKADEANQAKGRFLANVSHEMRTPLNGVIAMADVLRDTELNDLQRELVETLGTSAHLLLAQIEDVLDMSKIEAGRVQISQHPFDLGQVVASTVKVVLSQARAKGLDVTVDIAPDVNRWFEGDAHHLRQVLLNLVANAVKFTEKGHVRVRALIGMNRSADTDVVLVHFEVEDTGIGIAPEKQASIFEPFTQADDSITRVYGGTGLGTTIARQLVTLMNGTIGLESTPGQGSRFWFDVPFRKTEARDVEPIANETPKLTPLARTMCGMPANVTKMRGARVLVAEDNATNQRVAQLVLESGGHRPVIVNNGEEALDELAKGGYDLALFDLSMPGVSGLEALKLYRFTTDDPIPILILSANVTTEVIAECMVAGAAEFVPKPVRPQALLDAIERHLTKRAHAPGAAPFVQTNERPALTVVETPPVDTSVLADLDRLSKDPTFVTRFLRGFRSDAERLVDEIVEAIANRQYEMLKDSAHALKGGAGSVGATQLAALAGRFDKADHAAIRLNAAAWTEELTAARDTAFGILEAHLESHRQRTAALVD
jgi:two-component system sensor histidine kinase RpfC